MEKGFNSNYLDIESSICVGLISVKIKCIGLKQTDYYKWFYNML